jgi:hypothetical protein
MAIDEEIAHLAELRNQLLRVDDLRQLGLSSWQVRHRIDTRRLFRITHGVLSTVGPPFDFLTRCRATCLSVPEGVLSFSTAAFLDGIRRTPRGWLDLTIPSRTTPRLPGVHIHRTNLLLDHDVRATLDGLRVTSPARTLFDLASVMDGPALRSAIDDARHRKLVTDEELDEIGTRMIGMGRAGSVMFRHIVDPMLGETPVASGYELIVKEALKEAGLEPVSQHRLRLPNGNLAFLDLALLESRLDVEIDPEPTHTDPPAVAADKARDVQVVLTGWQPVRFSDEDVDDRLTNIVGYVRALHRQRIAA